MLFGVFADSVQALGDSITPKIKTFISPADPSLNHNSVFASEPGQNYAHEIPAEGGGFAPRRATFADKASWDVYPVADGAGMSVGSTPRIAGPLPAGRPFAVRPPVNDSWCDRLQTPHPAGLPVALFDGSVRTLHPNIDERIFCSLVTPAGGEVVGDY